MIEVELLKPHTHSGVLHAPGDTLELDDATARWLVDQGAARPIESTHEED